jgi:hypothetical protein
MSRFSCWQYEEVLEVIVCRHSFVLVIVGSKCFSTGLYNPAADVFLYQNVICDVTRTVAIRRS